MDEVMEKRRARKFNGKGSDRKTQYVLYQGVFSSNKGKMKLKNLKIFKTFKSFLNKKDTTASTDTIKKLKDIIFSKKNK